jgi:hypothetical protein
MAAPWGECARCGFKRRLDQLTKEWTGLRVCADTCKDPKPAELKPPIVKPEGVPLPTAAPATEPVFREDYPIPPGADL